MYSPIGRTGASSVVANPQIVENSDHYADLLGKEMSTLTKMEGQRGSMADKSLQPNMNETINQSAYSTKYE